MARGETENAVCVAVYGSMKADSSLHLLLRSPLLEPPTPYFITVQPPMSPYWHMDLDTH